MIRRSHYLALIVLLSLIVIAVLVLRSPADSVSL